MTYCGGSPLCATNGGERTLFTKRRWCQPWEEDLCTSAMEGDGVLGSGVRACGAKQQSRGRHRNPRSRDVGRLRLAIREGVRWSSWWLSAQVDGGLASEIHSAGALATNRQAGSVGVQQLGGIPARQASGTYDEPCVRWSSPELSGPPRRPERGILVTNLASSPHTPYFTVWASARVYAFCLRVVGWDGGYARCTVSRPTETEMSLKHAPESGAH